MTTLATFTTDAYNFLSEDLSPLTGILIIMGRLVGIGMIAIGMSRLHRHAYFHMMHRISPVGTIFYFLAGITLVSFMPMLTSFSTGFATTHSNLNNLMHACSSTQSIGGKRQFCPIIAYANDIKTLSTTSNIIKELMFALLMLIGIYAFLRGFTLLVRIGDGHQQGTFGKAITHIIAGVVGVNAPYFYNLFHTAIHNLGGP